MIFLWWMWSRVQGWKQAVRVGGVNRQPFYALIESQENVLKNAQVNSASEMVQKEADESR